MTKRPTLYELGDAARDVTACLRDVNLARIRGHDPDLADLSALPYAARRYQAAYAAHHLLRSN